MVAAMPRTRSSTALILYLLSSLTAFGNGNEWLSTAPLRSDWKRESNWSAGLPTAAQHLLLNHPQPLSQIRVRLMDEPAVAASVRLGSGTEQRGQLAITREELRVDAVASDAESGRVMIGDAGGTGHVLVRTGVLHAATALTLGNAEGSVGSLKIQRNSQVSCGVLQLTTAVNSSAELEINGAGSTIIADALTVGDGASSIEFSLTREMSPIQTLASPTLAGRLTVDTRLLPTDQTEVILIDNLSAEPIDRGFDEVHIIDSFRGYYELTYNGGDGNDVALVRSETPVTTLELWSAIHFGLDSLEADTLPSADPDEDGVSNIAEYKMGRSPITPEGAWMIGTQITDDLTGITQTTASFVERVDRDDVRLTMQAQLPGQHWQSSYFDIDRTTPEVNSIQVDGNAVTIGVPEVRLFAELQPTTDRMNVLFVVADDLSDWLGCMDGHPQAISPNIDRLAERGLLFQQAHSAGTICGPSRVSMLTGIAPSTSGSYRNPQELRSNSVLANVETLPGYFRNRGYHAVGSGKLFHDPDPLSWDEYWPSLTLTRPDQYRPANLPLNGIHDRGLQFDWGPIDAGEEVMSDYQVATWVGERLLTLPEDEPFFMGCGFFRPHLPFYAPPQYFDLFDPATIQLPTVNPTDWDDLSAAAIATVNELDQPAVDAAGNWQDAVHAYLASIAFMDAQVGRVMDFLDNSPHARNTIVVFVSDHGFLLGEKSSWRKQVLWDRCTHVPMIIVAPGVTTPGTVCDSPASLLDLFPTLTDLCDLETPNRLSGRSLVPQLEDPERDTLPVVTTRLRSQHGINDGRYHFIQYPTGAQELYDLWADPHEWTNLVGTPEADLIIESMTPWLPTVDAVPSP